MQSFDQSKLKKVETNEKSILNQEKSILEAANYDQSKLNKVEAVEKIVLPTDDGKLNFPSYLILSVKFPRCHYRLFINN